MSLEQPLSSCNGSSGGGGGGGGGSEEPAAPLCSVPWPRVHIPEACRGQTVVVGIDEAGRGPVLGSLIYTACFWPQSEDEAISKLAFNDSKQLTEEQREKLFHSISTHGSIGWVIEELTSERISQEMQRLEPVSLNTISYNGVIRMLECIASRQQEFANTTRGEDGFLKEYEPPVIGDVFIDTVGDPATYEMKLVQGLGQGFVNKYVIEKKADAKFKVVSAASIIAKVTRDRLLKDWEWKENISLDKGFGSGYPGDEKCVQWLSRAMHPVFGFPSLVRFSWSTSRDYLDANGAVRVTWECDDDPTLSDNTAITSFFSVSKADHGSGGDKSSSSGGGGGDKRSKRCSYFSSKRIKHLGPGDME